MSFFTKSPCLFVFFSQTRMYVIHRYRFYPTGELVCTLGPSRFCSTLLHFRHVAQWLDAFLRHTTALLRVPNPVGIVFAILSLTFASLDFSWKRNFNTLHHSGTGPGPFCTTLQHFLQRAIFAIPYSILGPGVADLQYLTAFQR